MAHDDRQSEQFIREVDEELRRAQLKAIWDRFAPLIIGACLLVVAITAGYNGWRWWEERQASQAGDRYLAALETLDTDPAAGVEALEQFVAEAGDGYAALARFRLAGESASAGEAAAALATYDELAADASVPQSLRDFARIRAALLALDSGDTAGAQARAEPLNQPGEAWRHVAREVLGTAAYASGDLQRARDYFSEIQQDAETPADLWVRSGMMTALIDGQSAAPGTEGDLNTPPAQEPAAPVETVAPEEPSAEPAAAPAELPVPATGPAADLTTGSEETGAPPADAAASADPSAAPTEPSAAPAEPPAASPEAGETGGAGPEPTVIPPQ